VIYNIVVVVSGIERKFHFVKPSLRITPRIIGPYAFSFLVGDSISFSSFFSGGATPVFNGSMRPLARVF
jgi:hypothetical protein